MRAQSKTSAEWGWRDNNRQHAGIKEFGRDKDKIWGKEPHAVGQYYLEEFDVPNIVCVGSLFPQTQRCWGKLVLLAFVFLCITWLTGLTGGLNEVLRLRV